MEAQTDWSKVMDPVAETDARFAMDSKLHVQFYLRPVLQETLSNENGRPIFADVEHVRILTPGDKLNMIDRVASQDDKNRFAAHYAKFKAGAGQEVIGTRLEAVPWMTRSKVEEYRYFNIHTVEQLANASDSVGQKFPNFHADRSRAQAFLDATTGDSARIRELEQQVAQLMAATQKQPVLEPEIKAPVPPVKK